MHEGNFTKQIVDKILKILKEQSSGKPKRVKVRVGEVFHLIKDSVLFHYELITKGTELEGVALDLQEDHVDVECNDCHKIGPVQDHHLLMCSHCQSLNVRPVKGTEIYIDEIVY